MISRIFRPFKEGFRGVFRHGAMSLSAATAVTITLFIISIFMLFTMNVRQFTQGIEQSVPISVQIDYDHESAEQEGAIELAISEIPGVAEIKYYSKAEEFQYFLDAFTDERTRAAMEPFENDNPMHDSYYVEVSDGTQLESIANQISQIPGVFKVNFGGASATNLISMLRTIRFGGGILALALSILAIFLIQNTIKLTILARADEIAIMRNVGATNGFIRSPFLIEGILIGALGAVLPVAGTYYGYRYLYNFTDGYIISQMFTLLHPVPFVKYVCLALLGIGMLVGLIGSFFSVTRYLRWRR
ncbi:MAG: permease-like cell division protein FtsX [Solobacterium sp.]|nr:permease-like cell division protein FtsX [Solobacterium sp.]